MVKLSTKSECSDKILHSTDIETVPRLGDVMSEVIKASHKAIA